MKLFLTYGRPDSWSYSWYTLMYGGTRDVNGSENISFVLWYVDAKYIICERLFCIYESGELDAKCHTEKNLSICLTKYQIRLDRMLRQCSDEASVMSGCNDGVQALYSTAPCWTSGTLHRLL